MGASVIGYWPGITDEQLSDQPGFFNDCKAWGDWMAERVRHESLLALHTTLGVDPLLSFLTDGVEETAVDWVTPRQMASAANRLRSLVLAKDPRVKPMVDAYALGADEAEMAADDFAQDLHDVAALAEYAESCGVPKMTLEVNW